MKNKLIEKYKSIPVPVKSSFWYTICNFINKAIVLLSMPIFTRLLSTEEYGVVTLFQSWYNIFIIFGTLNIFMNSYTKGLIKYEDRKEEFTSSMLGLSSTITIFLGLIYIAFEKYLSKIVGLSTGLMIAMFIQILVTPALEFLASKDRFDYKYKRYVIISISKSILSVLLGVICVLLINSTAQVRIFSDVFIRVVFCVSIYVYLMTLGKKFFNKEFWKYAILYNLPLIPHYLSTFILNQADKIMIGNMVGKTEAAIYGVSYSIGTIVLLIVNAINYSLVPYTYKKISENDTMSVKKNTKYLFMIVYSLCLLTMLFAPEVIYIFSGKDYYDAIWIIPPVACSMYFIFAYSMYSSIEYYYSKTIRIAIFSVVTAVLNIILNYIYIKEFGYMAAGYTTLVGYIMLALLHYLSYLLIIKKEKQTSVYNDRYVFIFSILSIVSTFLVLLLYNSIIWRYSLIIVVFLCFIIFRKKIMNIFKRIKAKE